MTPTSACARASAIRSCRRSGPQTPDGSSTSGGRDSSPIDSSRTMHTPFDAVVLGAGPAGATAALLLARAGWSVALVEKTEFPRRKVCGEFLSATNLPLLRELGLSERFLDIAGPDVRRVAIFAGRETVVLRHAAARQRQPRVGPRARPRAPRHDAVERAAAMGACVFQPYTASELRSSDGSYECVITAGDTRILRARVVIAAHGSWDHNGLRTQPTRRPAGPSDLFGFKARFVGTRLVPGLMPLLTFPGGTGAWSTRTTAASACHAASGATGWRDAGARLQGCRPATPC